MAFSVRAVANSILKIASEKGIFNISPMKLQKLVYIAHGWYLALFDKSLISEDVEAWQYGPVIRDLYDATKKHGNSPVPPYIENIFTNLVTGDKYSLVNDQEINQFLDQILDIYGGFTAFQLSSSTHKSGTPWSETVKTGDKIIPNEEIKKHFLELANN